MSTFSRMAIAIAASCCTPVVAADLRTVVDQAIRPIMAEYDVPGIAVAVTVDGKPAYFSYGLASKEDNIPVSDTTLFELGSVSKTFAATLVTYAVAEGKLSLADHPSRYLPQLKGSAIDQATVLHLGTYTAGGLPLQFPEAVKNDNRHMLDYFRHFKPDAAPGAQRRYSNPSLGLFGHIAGIALNTKVGDALQTLVFPHMGMAGSYVHVPDSAMANYAWGYTKANKPVRVKPDLFSDEAYGVKSSSADMIRYVQAQMDPGKLDSQLRRAVEGTHIGYFRVGEMVQGLGWEQYPYPVSVERLLAGNSSTMAMEPNTATQLTPPLKPSGATLYNKTGATSGFGAYVAFVPEKKIGIVILANKNYPVPARIKAAHAILSQLAP